MPLIRVAVCQITAHLAVAVGDVDYLREPFKPKKGIPRLADLSRHAVDISRLQSLCEERYSEWHSRRLDQILTWLATLDPLPHIVVFPECSIPPHDLYIIRDFADTHDSLVFAGTHGFRFTDEFKEHYRALDLLDAVPKKLRKGNSDGKVTSLMPVFGKEKHWLRIKSVASVFEHTDFGHPAEQLVKLKPISVKVRGESISILPAICAEALQLVAPTSSYDLLVISAYSPSTEPFEPVIKHHVQNQIPAIFCNDGAHGASSVRTAVDQRSSGIWWWNEPLYGCLPKGDAVLVVDVELGEQAIQTGVTNPKRHACLTAIAPIVAEHGTADAIAVAQELERISQLGDNSVQAVQLDDCLRQFRMTQIQSECVLQLKRLAQTGNLASAEWSAIGRSCVLRSVAGLSEIESELARECATSLDSISNESSDLGETALGRIAMLRRECLTRSRQAESAHLPSVGSDSNPAEFALDREDEASHVRSFLDHASEQLLLILGLEDVGKQTVMSMALRQTGRRNHFWVEVKDDSTLAYIVEILARHVGMNVTLDSTEGGLSLVMPKLIERFPLGTTVIMNRCEFLLDNGIWRDNRCVQFIRQLSEGLAQRRGKLVLISAVRLDVELARPTALRRLFVKGLPNDHGLTLLDQNLRRTGLEPTDYDISDRKEVVQLVGGHLRASNHCLTEKRVAP